MRKSLLLSLLIVLLCALTASAKKASTIKCELILNDGKKVEGWLVKDKSETYGPYMVKNVTDFVVATSRESKEGTSYNADDVKEIKLTNEVSGESLEYKSLYAVKSFTMPKSMTPSPKRYFWLVVYKGKKVTGYISTASNRVVTGVMSSYTERSLPFSYSVDGDDIAVTYHVPMDGTVIGKQADLKRMFERFPQICEYIDSKDFSLKAFKRNPLILLEKLDEIVTSGK